MPPCNAGFPGIMSLDLRGKRILIFVVAYNAERTIASVLNRIPEELRQEWVEVLVIDDFSEDKTFSTGLVSGRAEKNLRITMLRTPENQGYGGNQKLGYQYAIDRSFDIVALLHGDGQYAPEKLPELLQPLLGDEVDAIFGSRMLEPGRARVGGMPLYKYYGNRILTYFQNAILGTSLSEFHSGYRLYSTRALRRIPFYRNSNDFHFDTEIIVQLVIARQKILELPIPTYYGDEICHVNGVAYALNVCKAVTRAWFHQRNLFYDRKFDIRPIEEAYDLKLGYRSSHTMAIEAARAGARILDMGCGQGLVAEEFAQKAAHVTGIDRYAPAVSRRPNLVFHKCDLNARQLPVDASEFDQIFLLDVLEHLRDPEGFLEDLRAATGTTRPEIILSTPNVGFFVTRFLLLIGQFNYGRQGILDRTHTRLFTYRSLRDLLEQSGFEVIEMRGIPAPYPKALGDNAASRVLLWLNTLLIRMRKQLFAYQTFVRAKTAPTVKALLSETFDLTERLRHDTAEV
jgi:glycosyltransferase involved in cell wall biosynthesis